MENVRRYRAMAAMCRQQAALALATIVSSQTCARRKWRAFCAAPPTDPTAQRPNLPEIPNWENPVRDNSYLIGIAGLIF